MRRITAVERWAVGTGWLTGVLFKWAVAVAGASLLAANLMSKWGGK